MIKITRQGAYEKIEAHLTATGHCECCRHRRSPERFARLRNYEIEMELKDHFGAEFVVWEPCPFNGVHCTWGSLTGVCPA